MIPSMKRVFVQSVFFTATVAALVALSPRAARGGWWDDLDKGRRVRLSDLVAQPAVTEGPVTFTCVFHKVDAVFFPYFTHFSAETHVNLAVWNDGAPVWEKDAFSHDEPFLYLPRDHAQRDDLARLPMFSRIEVTGRVRDVYRETPWVEVLGFRKTGGTLGSRVVEAMMAADQFAAQGESARAEASYRRALEDPSLDEGYGLRIRKRYGDLLHALGREADALEVEGGGILSGTPSHPIERAASPVTTDPSGPDPANSDLPPSAPPADPSSPRPAPPAVPTARHSPIATDLPGIAVDPAAPAPSPAPPPVVGSAGPGDSAAAGPTPTSPGAMPPPSPFEAAPVALRPTPEAPAPPLPPGPLTPPKRTPRLAGVK